MKKFLIAAVFAAIGGVALAQDNNAALNAALDAPSATTQGITGVALDTQNPKRVSATPGSMNMVYAFFTELMYADFVGTHATVTAASSTPVLYVKTGTDPTGHLFLVRTKINAKDNDRSVKLGNAKFAGYSGINTPDRDWQLQYTAAQVQPGVWSITPTKPLAPGEYGLFVPVGTFINGTPITSTGGALYGFSVGSGPSVATTMPKG